MTAIQVYAFFILPVVLTGLGWAAVLLHEWSMRRRHSERRRHS